jgi:HTH-type transcriptional regulator, sugar sensing transcriptional regulator
MPKTTLVEKIKQLGFTDYEARCYLALLERGSMTVSEVAKLAEIPRSNAYEAMERLLAKGMCVSIPGKTRCYSASNPEILREKSLSQLKAAKEAEIESFEKRQKELMDLKMAEILELDKRRKEILEIKMAEIKEQEIAARAKTDDIVSELTSFFKGGRDNLSSLDYIKIYRTNYQIHNRYLELIAKTNREMLAFIKPPFAYTSQKQWDEQSRLQVEATERGVRKRVIYEMPPLDKVEEYFAPLVIWKPDEIAPDIVRVIDELPMKLMVFDDRYCFFTLEDPVQGKKSLTMVSLEHEAVARSFRFLFESYWEKSGDYFELKDNKYVFNHDAYINDKKKSEAEGK